MKLLPDALLERHRMMYKEIFCQVEFSRGRGAVFLLNMFRTEIF